MAPALSSNSSFLLRTTPYSRLTLANPRLKVFAKKAGPLSSFRFSKPGSAEEEGGDEGKATTTSNPLFPFNFGKVPDVKSLIPIVQTPSSGLSFGGGQRRKDPGTVFVAGAAGQAGVRIAQTLLREGFTVRAGVPDLGAAQDLARLAATYKIITKEELKRLNAVESTFQDAESIAKAMGNAAKVVVTIGPAENGPTNEVTTSDAALVIQAAQLAGVGHVAIIYDESPMINSTGNVLDGISSFFTNLFARTQPLTISEFLQKVVETDVSYTLIKTRLTEDDYSQESSYNVVLSAEGSAAGANDYKVAKSQIASVVANVFCNIQVAENKVVEVHTDPKAPSKPMDELFSAIPEDGRRKAYAEAIAKANAEEEAKIAATKVLAAAKAAKELEEPVNKKEQSLAEEAKAKAAVAGGSVEGLLDKAKDIGSQFSWEKFSSQISASVQKDTEKPKVQIATVRGQAKARSLPAKKAVVKQFAPKSPFLKVQEKKKPEAESKPEVRKIFGGLFQQETIYVDEA